MDATVRECVCRCGGKNHALHSIERLDVDYLQKQLSEKYGQGAGEQ